MSAEHDTSPQGEVNTPEDFFSIAERLSYMSSDSLAELAAECDREDVSPGTLALRKGLLDAVQLEIVETLLHPQETIPGYDIIDVLGKGGMGVVFRARQLNLSRVVALKTILVNRMGSASAVKRFEQEARTVAQLRHPNIVAAYDFGRHEGRVYFAMEFVDGDDVGGLIRRSGPVSEEVAWGIARQTAAGLAHAATHGVVHRDIKPGNLLLVKPPEGMPFPAGLPMVKIADFGLAILTADDESATRLTQDNATVGSPNYMAPEQFQQSAVDFRADMYALGATVYQMLTGRPPFDGKNITQVMAEKLSGSVPEPGALRPGLSEGTCQLIARLMASDPTERPTDYSELISQIDRLVPDLFSESPRNQAATPTVEYVTPTSVDAVGLTETSRQADVGRSRLLSFVPLIALGAVMAGVAWFAIFGTSSKVSPFRRISMSDASPERALFNGLNTSGWQQRGGNWVVPAGTATLSGTDGQLIRTLFRNHDGKAVPIDYYRLIVFIDRAKATAAEIHFGFAPSRDRNGNRYVLRWDEDGIAIGERDSATSDLKRLTSPTLPGRTGSVAAIIECQPDGWFVSINERPIASLPRRRNGELPEFRLAAQGGPAAFSEITLTELAREGS